MSIEKVKEYFETLGRGGDVKEFPVSSATVELAAQALDVHPARIAKTLSFESKEQGACILVVAAGDAKVDNGKFKSTFGLKAKMITPDRALTLTGHAVGGICPFCNPTGAEVYLDESLRRFNTIFPACGSANSAIELTCEELAEFSHSIEWVDVCKAWQED